MEFIISYSQLLPRMESSGKENLLKLMDMCDRLRQLISSSIDQPTLLNEISILEKFFSRFVDSVLIQQITVSYMATLRNYVSQTSLFRSSMSFANQEVDMRKANNIIFLSQPIERQ